MHSDDQGTTRPPKSCRRNEVGPEDHAIAVGSDEKGFDRPQDTQQRVAAQGQIVRNELSDQCDRPTTWQVTRDRLIVRMQDDAAPVQTEVQVLELTELGEQAVKVPSDPCAVAKQGGDVDGYCQPGLPTACPDCRNELPRPVKRRNDPRRPKAVDRRVDSTPDWIGTV